MAPAPMPAFDYSAMDGYALRFADLSAPTIASEPMTGRFRPAPAGRQSVSFVSSGDTAGPRMVLPHTTVAHSFSYTIRKQTTDPPHPRLAPHPLPPVSAGT